MARTYLSQGLCRQPDTSKTITQEITVIRQRQLSLSPDSRQPENLFWDIPHGAIRSRLRNDAIRLALHRVLGVCDLANMKYLVVILVILGALYLSYRTYTALLQPLTDGLAQVTKEMRK